MDREAYALFLGAQGLRIIRTAGAVWVEKRKLFIENVPPHQRIHMTGWDATKIFLRGFAVIRYTCAEKEGQSSAEFVCEDKQYDLSSLDPKARNKVRQGLKNCLIRQVDFELLAERGYVINCSALSRQGRTGPRYLTDDKLWKAYMAAIRFMPGIEPYGAFVGDRLCAYVLAVHVDDYVYTYHPFAEVKSLEVRPMNALIFTLVRDCLRKPGVNTISYGLQSFIALPALDDFKRSMGFRRRPIGRRILVNPLARPFLTRPVEWMARSLVARGRFEVPLGDFLIFAQSRRQQFLSGEHPGARS